MEFYDDRHLQLSVQEINKIKNEIDKSNSEMFKTDKKKRLKDIIKEIKIYCEYKNYDYKKVKKYYYL